MAKDQPHSEENINDLLEGINARRELDGILHLTVLVWHDHEGNERLSVSTNMQDSDAVRAAMQVQKEFGEETARH